MLRIAPAHFTQAELNRTVRMDRLHKAAAL